MKMFPGIFQNDTENTKERPNTGKTHTNGTEKKIVVSKRWKIVILTGIFLHLFIQFIYSVVTTSGVTQFSAGLFAILILYSGFYFVYMLVTLISWIWAVAKKKKTEILANRSVYPKSPNATLTLNGAIYPYMRLDIQKSLKGALESNKVGTVLKGKCVYKDRMEIDHCNIYLALINDSAELIDAIADMLNRAYRFPRGSVLQNGKHAAKVGILCGLAVYLNLSDIPVNEDNVRLYNDMLEKINEQLGEKASLWGIWSAANDNNYDTKTEEGLAEYRKNNPAIVGLYFYGENYADIKNIVVPVLEDSIFNTAYRIEQIN